jgi:hypothetical protein
MKEKTLKEDNDGKRGRKSGAKNTEDKEIRGTGKAKHSQGSDSGNPPEKDGSQDAKISQSNFMNPELFQLLHTVYDLLDV